MLKRLFFILIIFWPLLSTAQDRGNLRVYQDPYVDTLLEYYGAVREVINQDPDNKGIPGYRVQIFFDSGSRSGDRAREVKEEFEEEYFDVPAYLTWRAPNYRVRVGDFRTRLDAGKFLQEIRKDYPNAWVIKDEINYPKLN